MLISLMLFFFFFPKVTEGKQDLERASQLARKMKKEAASLSEWLSVTETELVQKSTSESLLGDLDTEISWAKVSCSSGEPPILCPCNLWHFDQGNLGRCHFSPFYIKYSLIFFPCLCPKNE